MPSVLVVDDDPELLRQIGCALLACGWKVRTVLDGAAALKALDAVAAGLIAAAERLVAPRNGAEAA